MDAVQSLKRGRYETSDPDFENANLLDINIVNTPNSITINGYLGDNYQNYFGNTQFGELYKGHVLVYLVFTQHSASIRKLTGGKGPDLGDWRLSLFYVNPRNDYLWNGKLYDSFAVKDLGLNEAQPVLEIATANEKEFLKGLGYAVLCWCLSNLEAFQNNNHVITLEAVAGDSAEKQRELVNYYKTMGFKEYYSRSDGDEYSSHSDEYTIMYGTVKDLKGQCGWRARNFSTLVKPFVQRKSLRPKKRASINEGGARKVKKNIGMKRTATKRTTTKRKKSTTKRTTTKLRKRTTKRSKRSKSSVRK